VFPLCFSNEAISTALAEYLVSARACHCPNEGSSRGQSTFLDPQPVAARRPWGRGWLLALSECRDQCVRGEQEAPAVVFVQKAVDENHPALNLARPLKPRRQGKIARARQITQGFVRTSPPPGFTCRDRYCTGALLLSTLGVSLDIVFGGNYAYLFLASRALFITRVTARSTLPIAFPSTVPTARPSCSAVRVALVTPPSPSLTSERLL
jgi:hypothetical protein